MADKIPFGKLFADLQLPSELRPQFSNAQLSSAVLDSTAWTFQLQMETREPAPLGSIAALEALIADTYGFSQVSIQAVSAGAASSSGTAAPAVSAGSTASNGAETSAEVASSSEAKTPAKPKRSRKKAASKEPMTVLMGKKVTQPAVSMRDLPLGSVVVTGRVFTAVRRETRKPEKCWFTFCMTDNTNSVTVEKYLDTEKAKALEAAIRPGVWLTVAGKLEPTRDGKDIVLTPSSIAVIEHQGRQDTAEVPRVELHLHTKMSNMDALTDTRSVIEEAVRWGHPAIAITDHGVVHSFPDADAAAKGKIKILYGMEGYFINDLDDRLAVHGGQDAPLEGDIVCFDIETTGLSARRDAITEIGAVVLRDGVVTDERFQTFVNPGRSLSPEIVNLTGITDDMLKDAPPPESALADFLRFVDGRPLAAHNAEFDIGFIRTGCERLGLDFHPTFIDSLILAQNLLPDLGKYKLDIVADALNLPDFNHHRASDDAATVAYMLIPFWKQLHEQDVNTLQAIDPYMETIRPQRQQANRHPKHIILLARNKMGLKHLYQLVSASNLEHFRRFPLIPKTLLNQHREGLIIGSACEAGELYQAILAGKDHDELLRIASYYDYLEIQPLCNNLFLVRNNRVSSEEELREYNRLIVQLGEELGKPVCATGDVHFQEPEEEPYRRILLAAKKFPDCNAPLPIYFRTTDEMLAEFAYLGQEKAYEVVVTNTRAIADQCETIELLPKDLFPPRLAHSREDLYNLVWDRARELYGDPPPALVSDRINVELENILGRGYDVIYMSAQKLVQRSLENGYLVGSRGSVGSSLVAYLAGITEVNALPPHYRCPKCRRIEFVTDQGYGCGADMPDKVCPDCGTPLAKDGFDIPFETFLGFGGDKVPDIDLNFSGEYQARAHHHAVEMFGKTHVFRAGTIGKLAEKTTYGFVKKYLEENGMTVSRAEETRLALGCVNVRRTTGQHPGGLVVVPDNMDVEDFCPVQHPADDSGSDIITTHFDYHRMEANLLKLDMLGHDDPSMIRMMEDLTGVDARRDIPLDDPETMSLFTSSKVLGFENDEVIGPTGAVAIPEFNTRFTRQMLIDTQPKDFNTLVRLSGFSHGTDVWSGNARDLILSGTAGVLETVGCRDDIMLYLISQGMDARMSFKIMEAVRKGKVKKGGFQEGWVEAMEAHSVPDWYIKSLGKIGYLFPKAHAVAYVMMAFRIAWFKVHHPLAFYATYFTIRAKAFDAEVCCTGLAAVKKKIREIEENKNASAVEQDLLTTLEVCYEFYLRGYHFASIDIYHSDATRFQVVENGLLPPFTSVHGLGESVAQDTVERRGTRQFLSIEEFADCCSRLSKTHIDQLKRLGAFAGMADTSQMTLF